MWNDKKIIKFLIRHRFIHKSIVNFSAEMTSLIASICGTAVRSFYLISKLELERNKKWTLVFQMAVNGSGERGEKGG